MGILLRLASAVGFVEKRDAMDNRWWGPTGTAVVSHAGIAVTRDSALELDTVQAVMEVLAGAVSTLPLMVYRRTDGGDGREAAKEHPLYRLLHDRPNARQTSQEFRDELTRHLAFDRNAYCRIVPGADYPVGELEIIHPTRVGPIERRADGRVYYSIAPIEGSGRVEVLRDDEIWHIRKPPLKVDGLRAAPVWETGRETLGRALAVERYGARFFKNSGHSGGVIKHPGNFRTREERDLFLENWRVSRTGEGQHADRLLTHGVDYVPHSVQNDQAQFIETLREVAVKVLSLWQMQPHRTSRLDRATFSNIEAQGLEFVVYALAPWIAAIEQAAWRDLLLEDEKATHFVEFNVAGLLRGDIKSRYQAYAMGRQWGWLSVNDIRQLENQRSIGAAGDIYLQPSNMTPAGQDASGNDGQGGQQGDPNAP